MEQWAGNLTYNPLFVSKHDLFDFFIYCKRKSNTLITK